MTTRLQDHVAIVGGGPVGLMTALFLDQFGVKSVVFNKDPDTRHYPKGSTENARTMEHFRRVGLAGAMRKLGLPYDHPTDVAYFTRLNGPELARLRMPSEKDIDARRAAAAFDDQQPEPIFRANQMFIDPVLLAHARTRPSITIAFGVTVDAISEQDGGVDIETIADATGAQERWRFPYAVGADGAQGVVRRALGISYGGHEDLKQAFHGGRMVSTHIRSRDLHEKVLSKRLAWQYWTLNPQVRSVILSVNGRDEYALFSRPKDDEPLPDADAVRRVVRLCAGMDLDVEVLAQSPWNSGVARVVDTMQQSRIFLAGDSAHLFTPTGGFGMNTGVDDASNLAWKLAGAMQGWAGPNLLASYDIERKAIAWRNTTAARELAKRIGGLSLPANIEEMNPAGEQARRDLGAFLSGNEPQFGSAGVQLGARYDHSPIVFSDAPAPPDVHETYYPTSVPGGRAPHLWLGETRGAGDSLFDRMGAAFTLVRRGDDDGEGERLAHAARASGLPIDLLAIPERAAHLYERRYTLVRPDQHVAWRSDRLDGGSLDMIRKCAGW
jgi:2-polyprenyl-6-methoxyphenol hydroxylase-like FAD-dependent oxidoreductase